MPFASALQTAETIAREAAARLLHFYRGDFHVDLKNGSEPVTEADRVANEWIVRRLREAFPQDGIVAEESSVDAAELSQRERIWMVDPMDGTREFINHTDEFAVMIGLSVRQRAVLGVVVQPASNTLYRGIVGAGAEWVQPDGTVVPMRVRQERDLSQLRLICSRSHLPPIVERMMQQLGIQQMMRSGSVGLKIGKIGTGVCDLYLHPSGGTKLWDSCAPEAILRAAGGMLTDFDGNPIAYDPAHLHNDRGLLASNGVTHAALLKRLRGAF